MTDYPTELRALVDHPALNDIKWGHLVATSPGCEHVWTENFASLATALIAVSVDQPKVFETLGQHYEALGHEWLEWLTSLDAENLGELTDIALADRLHEFVSYYRRYATIVWIPFILEFRYSHEYPRLIKRIAEHVVQDVDGEVGRALRRRVNVGSMLTMDNLGIAEDFIRAILDFSPRRTMSEQKDYAMRETAKKAVLGQSPALSLLRGGAIPSIAVIDVLDSTLAADLLDIHCRFAWIAHWGYPPRYRDATVAEIIGEFQSYLALETAGETDNRLFSELYNAVLDADFLSASDKQLIRDVNYYRFLRTYRMEMKIRAQYLSIPIFREIERRAVRRRDFGEYDVYNMVPPEIIHYLESGYVPEDLAMRKNGWALNTYSDVQEWQVLAGPAYTAFADGFYGVIGDADNARGTHNVTAEYVGGKAANLYALRSLGVDTERYFVVTAYAFNRFVETNNLRSLIEHRLAQLAGAADGELDNVSAELQEAVRRGSIPSNLADAIAVAASALGPRLFAVRSSASVEDASDLSWAGRFASVMPVTLGGLDSAVKDVWASLFSGPALRYALHADKDPLAMTMAAVVQSFVPSEVSGVMNTVANAMHPAVAEIEVIWGLGSPLVDGTVTPDRYLIDTATGTVLERFLTKQATKLASDGWATVSVEDTSRPKLSDGQLLDLAALGKRIESELGAGQDIEFSYVGERLLVLQTRPLTTLDSHAPTASHAHPVSTGQRLVTGMKGTVNKHHTAKVQVLRDISEAESFEAGNILVLHAATPAWDSVVFRASGLITNEGGATSHAIRVANERAIPAVVGTETATDRIGDRTFVHIDTSSDAFVGKVYQA